VRPKKQSKTQAEKATARDRKSAVSEVLFLSIGEGAIVIDEKGKVSRVNKIALEILGYRTEDLLGKWYPEVVVAEDEDGRLIPTIERPIMEVFLSGKPVSRRIYYRRKDGSRVPVSLTVSPVILDGEPLGAIQIFRDITEELQLEHAKDEFISIASHQLRTPATVVKQYLGMILDGYVDSEEQKLEMIKLAYEHNESQLDIINDLLKVAQVEANKIVPYRKNADLVKLLQGVIKSQQQDYIKKGMELKFISTKKSLFCNVDPLHMRMVFENLINNANKYSPEGSTVTVELVTTPAYVTVRIKDQGIGIDAKDIPKLFKKFSRANNVTSTASGTGLGLYWAKKLIELHKGKIHLTSELGKGTTFSVSLPRTIQI
jgi:two-component system, OmpR family, phosphate regulon sensor histidine kinase PhoR